MIKTVTSNKQLDLITSLIREQMGVSEPFEGPAAAAGLHGPVKDPFKGLDVIGADFWDSLSGHFTYLFQNIEIILQSNGNQFLQGISEFEDRGEHSEQVKNFIKVFSQKCSASRGRGTGVLGRGTGEGGMRQILRFQDPNNYCMSNNLKNSLSRYFTRKRRMSFWSKYRDAERSENPSESKRKLLNREFKKFQRFVGSAGVGTYGASYGRSETRASKDKSEDIYAKITNERNAIEFGKKQFGLGEGEMVTYFTNLKKYFIEEAGKDVDDSLIQSTKDSFAVFNYIDKLKEQKITEDFIAGKFSTSGVGSRKHNRSTATQYRESWIDSITGNLGHDIRAESEMYNPFEEEYYKQYEEMEMFPGASLAPAWQSGRKDRTAEVQEFLGVFPKTRKKISRNYYYRPEHASGIIRDAMFALYKTKRGLISVGKESDVEVRSKVFGLIVKIARQATDLGIENVPGGKIMKYNTQSKKHRTKTVPNYKSTTYKRVEPSSRKTKKPPADTLSGAWYRAKNAAKQLIKFALDEQIENNFESLIEAAIPPGEPGYNSPDPVSHQKILRKFLQNRITILDFKPEYNVKIGVVTDSPKANLINHISLSFDSKEFSDLTTRTPDWCPIDCFPLMIDGFFETYAITEPGSGLAPGDNIDFAAVFENDQNFLIKVATDHAKDGTEKFFDNYYKNRFVSRLRNELRLLNKWLTLCMIMNLDPTNRKGTSFWSKLSSKQLTAARESESFEMVDLATGILLNVVFDETAVITSVAAPAISGYLASVGVASAATGPAAIAVGLTLLFVGLVLWDPFGWFSVRKDFEDGLRKISQILNNISDIAGYGLEIKTGEEEKSDEAPTPDDPSSVQTDQMKSFKTGSTLPVAAPYASPSGSKVFKEQEEEAEGLSILEKNKLIVKELDKFNKIVGNLVNKLEELITTARTRMLHFSAYSVEETLLLSEKTDALISEMLKLTESEYSTLKIPDDTLIFSKDRVIELDSALFKGKNSLQNRMKGMTATLEGYGDMTDSVFFENNHQPNNFLNELLGRFFKKTKDKKTKPTATSKPTSAKPVGPAISAGSKVGFKYTNCTIADVGDEDWEELINDRFKNDQVKAKNLIDTLKADIGKKRSFVSSNFRKIQATFIDSGGNEKTENILSLDGKKECVPSSEFGAAIDKFLSDNNLDAGSAAPDPALQSQDPTTVVKHGKIDTDQKRRFKKIAIQKAISGVMGFYRFDVASEEAIRISNNKKKAQDIVELSRDIISYNNKIGEVVKSSAKNVNIDRGRLLRTHTDYYSSGENIRSQEYEKAKKQYFETFELRINNIIDQLGRGGEAGQISNRLAKAEGETVSKHALRVALLNNNDNFVNTFKKANEKAYKKYDKFIVDDFLKFYGHEQSQTRVAENEDFLKMFGSKSKVYQSYSSGLLTGKPGGASAIQGIGIYNLGALTDLAVGTNEKISKFKEVFEEKGPLGSVYLYSEGEISRPFNEIQSKLNNSFLNVGKPLSTVNDEIQTIYKDVVTRWVPRGRQKESKDLDGTQILEIRNSVFGDNPGDNAVAKSTNPIKSVITYSNSTNFAILNEYLEDVSKMSDDEYKQFMGNPAGQPTAPAQPGGELKPKIGKGLFPNSSFGNNKEELINILTAHKMFVNSLANALNQILLIDKAVSEESKGSPPLIARKSKTKRTSSSEGQVQFQESINKALQSFSIKHECLGAISSIDQILSKYNIRMFKFIEYFYNYTLKIDYEQEDADGKQSIGGQYQPTTRGLHQPTRR